jgi:16S rRNA (cytosine967-C5)-methyltransferase
MPSRARKAALRLKLEIKKRRAYSGILLDNYFSKNPTLSKIDRSLITELVLGSLRRQKTLDWLIYSFLDRPLSSLPSEIQEILRLAIYQIVFLNKIPDRVAVHEAVALTKEGYYNGLAPLVNGVLRSLCRQKENLNWPDKQLNLVEYLSVYYSHPDWLIESWIKEFGVCFTQSLCQANNQNRDLSVRVNLLKTSLAALERSLENEQIKYWYPSLPTSEGLLVDSLSKRLLKKGYMYVQDLASMLVSLALSPKPGETVIDFCAAPGGKTTHLCQLMRNQGRIIAVEKHSHRAEILKANCYNLGCSIVEVIVADACQELKLPRADKILVDAPCSGLGTLYRKPDLRWQRQANDLDKLSGLQKDILVKATSYLKPGGVLVYSVCTIGNKETTEVVEYLQESTNLTFDSLPKIFSKIPNFNKHSIQLLPHIHNCDGMFIARFKKLKPKE